MLGTIVKVTNIIDENKFLMIWKDLLNINLKKPHFLYLKNMEALKRGYAGGVRN